MHHHLKEANAMFRICTMVRDQLRKELDAGESYEAVGQRLKDFYKVTSPKVYEALCKATPAQQMGHLSEVLHCHILVVLDKDESIDFPKLRAFLTKTWPDMEVDEAIRPTKPLFTTISGKEVCADPSFNVLLEKVGPDWTQQSSPKLQEMLKSDDVEGDQVIDRRHDIQATLYNYWCHTKEGVFGPMDFLWANDFPTFEKWAMDNGFKHGMTIIRKEMEGGYTPDNCYVGPRPVPNKREHPSDRY